MLERCITGVPQGGPMGTSTSQRSPATMEWERVRELYRQPDPDPGEIASRIVAALDPQTRSQLAAPGVSCCLQSLLQFSCDYDAGLVGWPAGLPSGPPLLALAQVLRERAEQRIAAGGLASRFADIGLHALGTCVLEAGAGDALGVFHLDLPHVSGSLGAYAREGRLADLSLCYLAHDFDHLFRYFVSRDLSDFVGSAAVPNVASGALLRDAVTLHCRETVRRVQAQAHEPTLRHAMTLAAEDGQEHMHGVFREMIDDGLELLAAGG